MVTEGMSRTSRDTPGVLHRQAWTQGGLQAWACHWEGLVGSSDQGLGVDDQGVSERGLRFSLEFGSR